MQVLSIEEIEQVSGADLLSDIGKGALAGGFAGLYVAGGAPPGFVMGAIFGAIAGATYYYYYN